MRWVLKNIQKHGWHANGIPGEASTPAWTYSVGLFAKYGQPELIVFGLEIETMHEMISRYADLLQAGKEYGDGVKIDGIIPSQPCVLREVHVSWREPLLCSASWYYHYQEYPVLQCFCPDRHGYFPWDDHCNKRSRKVQPLLYEKSVEKTGLPKSLLVDEPWRFADSLRNSTPWDSAGYRHTSLIMPDIASTEFSARASRSMSRVALD